MIEQAIKAFSPKARYLAAIPFSGRLVIHLRDFVWGSVLKQMFKIKSIGDAVMNNNKILVTYASRAGSTAEIAEAIGKTLSQGGTQVDVLPMQDVKDLSVYRAVVAGSAIRSSKWLPEAMQFVQTHRAVLAQKPFATFTVCITLAMSNTDQYRQAVAEWIQPVRAQVSPSAKVSLPECWISVSCH